MDDYLSDLNISQKKAVTYSDGPQLIIAGAGSGKTRVLTYKIAYLINSGFNPSNVLSLTFTNKAAREMKARMAQLTDKNKINLLWMGTFHSIFSKILRIEADLVGYPKSYTIYDAEDSKKLIKEIVKSFNLDKEQYPANKIFARISKAKNNLILPNAYENNSQLIKQDLAAKRPELVNIYKSYVQNCKKAAAMDFDDLLVNTNILLRDYPDILNKYQNLFKYILVDEYQDTNYAQYIILKKLSALNRKICVVGDDSQSIYAFRGAKIENILNFRNDFSDLKLFKLEKNYRSTKNIVNAANSLIAKNKNRIPKTVFTENETGDKIKILEKNSDRAEAYFVAEKLKEYAPKYKYSDIAVLYRTNAQSRVFEDILRKYAIPYKLYGSISFYQRAEIKNIVAYLRLIINKDDDQALKRIINFPRRGIGKISVDKLTNAASKEGVSLWQIIKNKKILKTLLNSRAYNLIGKFENIINIITEKAKKLEVNELIDFVLERTAIKRTMAEDRSPEGISKFANVQEFTNAVQDYISQNEDETSLEKFLEDIALATDQDTDNDQDSDKLSLMTIHAAKGLEFKIVFIVGVEEGLFPSFMAITNPDEIEEERRLFYVAITRSQKELFIISAKTRMKWGQYQQVSQSRFISEIDENYVDLKENVNEFDQSFDYNSENYKFAKKNHQQSKKRFYNKERKTEKFKKISSKEKISEKSLTKKVDEKTGIAVGMKVSHSKFGKGEVLKIEGNFPQTRALVNFNNVGQKKLLLKFAKLQILN